MEVISWNLHHGSYLNELTQLKLPHGTCPMEGTSWNLHNGNYLINRGSHLVQHNHGKLPDGPYTIEVTS